MTQHVQEPRFRAVAVHMADDMQDTHGCKGPCRDRTDSRCPFRLAYPVQSVSLPTPRPNRIITWNCAAAGLYCTQRIAPLATGLRPLARRAFSNRRMIFEIGFGFQ